MPENANGSSFNVVVQTAFLGDLLLSIGLLKHLRRLHPERKIGLVCREKLGDFFLRTGLVDELFEIRKGDAGSYRAAAERLRACGPLHVYCPHSSIRTAIFVRSLQAADSVGFHQRWNSWAFQRRVKRPDAWPDVLRQLSLLQGEDADLAVNLQLQAGEHDAFARDADGRLSGVPAWASVSLRDRLRGDAAAWSDLRVKFSLAGDRRTVLIFPGSVWATKRWTPEGFTEAGQRLAAGGARVILMGAGNEVALAEKIAAAVEGAVSLAGKTDLYESALLLAHADLVLGNDSASIHLAAAAECPTVAVFGPTVVEQGFRPWNDRAWIVERRALACRPCGPHGHHKCPIGTHECMKSVTAGEVLKAAALGLKSL